MSTPPAEIPTIGAVVIGRNEGPRLIDCLTSLRGRVAPLVYVDSGSTDGSIAAAERLGADVVHLDRDTPFTAARARNAGLARLHALAPDVALVQFVDGDCALQGGWLAAAGAFLAAHPEVAVACGRRRERFPEASVYNRLADIEWNTPVGRARSCGGDALMRCAALDQVGAYDPRLIAGEEPELCVRLRQAGWQVWRLAEEMTWHDAAILRFGQWWTRTRRAGHAYAEGAALHGAAPERHNVAATRRALIWGAGVPLAAGLAAFASPLAGLAVLLVWPAQVLRLGLSGGDWARAFFLTVGKIPEALGVLGYWRGRLTRSRATLIEYKGS